MTIPESLLGLREADVLRLEAGPELDRLVALLGMGWGETASGLFVGSLSNHDQPSYWRIRAGPRQPTHNFAPSEDWWSAGMVIERCGLSLHRLADGRRWRAIADATPQEYGCEGVSGTRADACTPQMAVCLCAVLCGLARLRAAGGARRTRGEEEEEKNHG